MRHRDEVKLMSREQAFALAYGKARHNVAILRYFGGGVTPKRIAAWRNKPRGNWQVVIRAGRL